MLTSAAATEATHTGAGLLWWRGLWLETFEPRVRSKTAADDHVSHSIEIPPQPPIAGRGAPGAATVPVEVSQRGEAAAAMLAGPREGSLVLMAESDTCLVVVTVFKIVAPTLRAGG
jgi:hypothetical protein